MNKKGFTLVELLAVIAILAILVIIALPNVLKMYNTSKKNIFLVEAKEIYGEVSKKYISESLKGNKLSYVNSEDNTKLEMTGNELKYCIQVDVKGKITAMKIGNNNYYLFYDGSKNISKLDLNDVYEGKYVQNKCDASTTITKDGTDPKPVGKACTYDGDINAGDAIQMGKYTYHYKQDYSAENELKLTNIASDTFHVELTDKESTDAVTEAPCSSINDKLVTSMALMFYNSKASSIDLSSFNTSNVTNMMGMFFNSKTSSIDLSSFNTSNVTNMAGMFAGSQATTLDLSNFDTSKVTHMFEMFSESQATTLDLSSFNTSSITDMSYMFCRCKNLKTIYASNKFNIANVTDSDSMFDSAYNLVGGSGTVYDYSKIDKTYARIDGGASNPGYFTLKN